MGVALIGAASGYIAYQKKKLCFKIQGGEFATFSAESMMCNLKFISRFELAESKKVLMLRNILNKKT